MSASVRINFAGGSASATTVALLLGDATVSPDSQDGVVVAMASALTNITVLAGQVSVSTPLGARLDGSVEMAIAWQSGDEPKVTLNGFAPAQNAPPTVTWPTADGPATQILTPGEPMPLSGIVAS